MVPDDMQVIPDGYKACEGPCGVIKQATEENFHKDSATADGLKTWCKDCRKAQNDRQRGKYLTRAVGKLDRAVLEGMRQLSQGNQPLGRHVSDVTEQLVLLAGGPYGFAQHCWGQFLSSRPGSPQRQRMLEMIGRFVFKDTELGGATLQLDNMTVEEVQELLNKRIEDRAKKMLTIYVEAGRSEKVS